MMANGEDDYEWQPPTEAEMKIIQARRERSNRISKLMGDYLLKGYKMLGSSCSKCDTILLQDKQKKNYCVSCSELADDNVKDDPALNQEAARRQVAEQQQRVTPGPQDVTTEAAAAPLPSLSQSHLINGNPEPYRGEPAMSGRRSQTSRSSKRSTSECSQQPLGQGTSPGIVPSYSNPSMHCSPSSQSMNALNQASELRGSALSLSSVMAKYDMTEPLTTIQSKLVWATSELQKSGSVESSIQLCQLVKSCAEALSALHNVHYKEA